MVAAESRPQVPPNEVSTMDIIALMAALESFVGIAQPGKPILLRVGDTYHEVAWIGRTPDDQIYLEAFHAPDEKGKKDKGGNGKDLRPRKGKKGLLRNSERQKDLCE